MVLQRYVLGGRRWPSLIVRPCYCFWKGFIGPKLLSPLYDHLSPERWCTCPGVNPPSEAFDKVAQGSSVRAGIGSDPGPRSLPTSAPPSGLLLRAKSNMMRSKAALKNRVASAVCACSRRGHQIDSITTQLCYLLRFVFNQIDPYGSRWDVRSIVLRVTHMTNLSRLPVVQ